MPRPHVDWNRVMSAERVLAYFGVALDSCPFCDGRGVGLYAGPLPHVTCAGCGADGPLFDRDEQHLAVRAWNRRSK